MGIKESVMKALSQADGIYRSGESLAKELGVSRNAVWKAIQALREEGCAIESRKKCGYRLLDAADYLDVSVVETYLHTSFLGHPTKVFPVLESTNESARMMLRTKPVRNGTVLVANCQTAGKGRQGRTFYSPAGSGLYFSVILNQPIDLSDASLLTACAAVAAARAIDKLYITDTRIKWVNDLYLNEKKCCGILTEGCVSLEYGRLEYAVVGIGINVRNTKGNLPEDLWDSVTSLEEALPGRRVCRGQLLAAILYELEQLLTALPDRRFLQEYRQRSCLIGKTVDYVWNDGETKKVLVQGISDDCGLIIQDSYGTVETLRAGEVRLKK